MHLKAILILFVFSSTIAFCQTVNIGIRLESLGYNIKYLDKNYSEFKAIPLPLSGYLKAGIIFSDKYEAELKGGVQLSDTFVGPEYALLFKYNIVGDIFPLVTYMIHFNSGDSNTGEGTYNNSFHFIGAGIEAKLSKLFDIDLIYYVPVGKKGLGYSLDFTSYSDKVVTTSQIGPLIKLGLIFNILNF